MQFAAAENVRVLVLEDIKRERERYYFLLLTPKEGYVFDRFFCRIGGK